MATCTNIGVVTNISSFAFGMECTHCSRKNKYTEAIHFCVECREYLCLGCTEWHKSFPSLAGHTVLEKADLKVDNNPDASALRRMHSERFAKVRKNVVTTCHEKQEQAHSTIATANDQTTSTDQHQTPDVACTPDVDRALDVHHAPMQKISSDANDALLKASNQMRNLKEKLDKAINDLNIAKQNAAQEILTFRAEVNQILDELEKETMLELDKQYQTLHTHWLAQTQTVITIIQLLEKRAEQLRSTDQNKTQQPLLAKMVKDISTADKISNQLVPSSVQITFSRNLAIKSCFEQLSSLGNVSYITQQPREIVSNDSNKRRLYKVKESSTYNVNINSDCENCHIWGACVLDSGALLIADNWNKKLKLFDISKKAGISYCTLPASPLAVCNVSDVEAAASLCNTTIQFVSTCDQKLLLTRQLHIDHGCFGLAQAGDNLFLTDDNINLYVHTLNGELLRKINKDQSGQQIFSTTKHVAISSEGLVHAVDYNNGLITLDAQGQVVWKYAGSDLKGGHGVCTDDSYVFVCGHHSQNVLQLGLDGHKYGELVTKSHGLNYPRNVCFDKKRSRLIITNSLDGNILVFTLE